MPPQMLQFLEAMPGFGLVAGAWVFLKALFIFLDLALLGLFLFSVRQGWKFRPHLEVSENGKPANGKLAPILRKDVVRTRWRAVTDKAGAGSLDALRIALIEADTLTDDVLKWINSPGEHMADRLGAFDAEEVKSLEGAWRAHRLRNDLVHTPGFTATPEEIQKAMEAYEKFLAEIGAF